MTTLRCIAFRKREQLRCDGVPEKGQVLCPIHVTDKDNGNDTYDVCIVPIEEFFEEARS